MTTQDIQNIQIIATTNDGKHYFTFTENQAVIDLIASFCEFVPLKENCVGTISLDEVKKKD